MALSKTIELGNLKFSVTKRAVYINDEPFEHTDIMELCDWLRKEVSSSMSIEKVAGTVTERIDTSKPNLSNLPKEEKPLPSADDLARRSAGREEAAMRLKVGDAFKSPGDADSHGQRIYGTQTVDLAAEIAKAGITVTQKSIS